MLLRSSAASKPDCPLAAAPGQQVDGLRLQAGAGGGTEAVVSLPVDVDPAGVHLGGAPGGPCWLSSVYPVGAAVVSHSVEGEGEHAGLAGGRTAGDNAAARRGHCGGGGGSGGGCRRCCGGGGG